MKKMKKSKSLFAAILAVLSIGLVSCGNENNPSQPSNNPTTPSNNSQTPSVKNSYTFDVNGELKEGMTVTLIFKNNGSAIVEQASVVYSVDDASKATVSGNKITFTGNGTVKITATYKGETIEKTVEVAEGEHIYTIAEAKAASSDLNNLIKMRGKVTASLGKSAYISDTTGGAYIYNWSFNSADTAITNKSFTVGQTVDITAFIVHSNSKDKNGNQNERGLQISNWNSEKRERVSGTSAIVSTTEVEAMKPIELDEAGYKALTYDKVGNLYTFEAEYVSGNPKEKGVNVKFKLGNTDIVLRTDKYDPASPSDTLVTGKKYKITAPLSWFNGAQFAYASSGVSIVEADAKPLEVSYTGNAYVGQKVTLETTASGVKVTEGVTYTIEEGIDLASLENGVLTITGEGTIKVKATYVKDGKTLTAEVTINATALALSKLSELKSMTSGKVKSRGYVMGYTGTPRIDYGLYDKVFIADGEDYFILYKVKPEQLTGINVGDLIEFTGDISHFPNGSVTTYETRNNVITKLTEADPSIVKPTATELTSSSATFTFGQDNISKAYKINQGVVISNTEDSSGNMTVKFTLGSNEYDLFMDSRDYEITKDPFTKLTVGTVFNANVFAAASNFFCPSNIEIISQQEVLTMDKEKAEINIHGNDKTLQLNATYTGGSNTDPIVWSSSAESVATVDQNGLVTGVAVGETIITAKKSETLSVQAKITVVDENITKVKVSFNSDIADLLTIDDSAKTATLTTQGITFLIKQEGSPTPLSQMKDYLSSSNSLRFYQGYSMEISVASGTIKAIKPDSYAKKAFTAKNISSTDFTVTDIDTVSMKNTTSSKISMKAVKQVQIFSLEFTLGE